MFVDRVDAGRRLAQRLQYLRGEDPVVLGLPRGGVPVAFEVAVALDAQLDVIVVRKLGVPFHPELGMGAIGDWFLSHLSPARHAALNTTGEDWLEPEPEPEEAGAIEPYGDSAAGGVLATEREEAQGVEVFDDPDAVIPASVLREGSPGHETLSGDQAGLERDSGDETRERVTEESSDI